MKCLSCMHITVFVVHVKGIYLFGIYLCTKSDDCFALSNTFAWHLKYIKH